MILSATDKILISRNLSADRARAEAAMDTLPNDWAEGKIIEGYELGTKADSKPIKCSFPGKHRHGIGAIVETPSGAIFRAGNTCAVKEFEEAGANWNTINNKFKEDKARQRLLNELIRIEDNCRPALDFMRSDEIAAAVNTLAAVISDFRSYFKVIKSNIVTSNMPFTDEVEDVERMTELREAHQQSLDKVNSDFEKGRMSEKERDSKLQVVRSSWLDRRIMKTVTRNYCPGEFRADILVMEKTRIKNLTDSEAALARAYRDLTKSNSGTLLNSDLQRKRDQVKSIARDWLDASSVFAEYNQFFSVPNLSILRSWSQQRGVHFVIEIAQGELQYNDSSEDVAWKLPSEISINTKPISALID